MAGTQDNVVTPGVNFVVGYVIFIKVQTIDWTSEAKDIGHINSIKISVIIISVGQFYYGVKDLIR